MKKKKTIILLSVSLIWLLTLNVSAAGVQSGNLRVGAGKVSITPPEFMFPTGVEHKNFIGVHDSVFVRSIVIDNGITRAALVSLEMGNPPEKEEFYEAITRELNIKAEHLFISATHSHNTLSIDQYPGKNAAIYYDLVINATIKSLKEATARLQPARVGYETGKAYVNTNRDQKIGEGYHMGYNPDGPSDKTVTVVTFTSLSGDPIAVYANYPCHAVLMYRAKTRDGHQELSGDLPGAASRYIESHFNGLVAVYGDGAAGDQNPLFMATYNQDAPDVYDTGAGGYAILDVMSRRLGEEMVRLIRATRNTYSTVSIWGKKTIVTCPGRKRKYPADPNVPTGGYLAPSVIEMVDGDPVSIPLHLLMIGDIAFAGVAGDFFTEIGMHIKEQSVFDRTLIVTKMPKLSKVPNNVGYIPTDKAYLMPSEKAIYNPLKPGCAETSVIDAYNAMMNEYVSLRIN